MRIDSNHSSSVCTRPLVDARLRDQPSLDQLDRAIRVRDAYDTPAPGRISGPKLDDLQPRFCAPPPSMRDATGAGYPERATGSRVSQKACLEHVEKLHGSLKDIKLQYTEWKAANPNAPEPTDGEKTMGEILELPVHEQCVRILCIVIHEHPETIDECRHAGSSHEPQGCRGGHGDDATFGNIIDDGREPSITIPGGEIPGQVTGPTAPTAPAAPPGGDFLSEMGKMFGPLAQMLGGLLQNPAVIGVLAAAAQLLNLVAPGLGVAVGAAIPLIAPLAGMLLQGLGGAMSGAPAGAGPGAPGAPAGGMDLGALVSGLSGLMGATGGVAPGAAPPVPAPA